MKKVYALVDCNNFFVSCERIFCPELNNKPTAVLSNNDGCIVARSQEVKDLGIKMGEPYFKIKDILLKNNVRCFSSNFSLYSDISRRVMNTLANFSPEVEVYSVDEAYLELSTLNIPSYLDYGFKIKDTIKKWVGVPISVGIASSKTLAKVAIYIAKRQKNFNFVCDINNISAEDLEEILKQIPVDDVWGIGRRSSFMLKTLGVKTAYDFVKLDEKWVRRNMGKGGWSTYAELHGVDVITHNPDKLSKSAAMSRTFRNSIKDFNLLASYLTTFIAKTTERIRYENLTASAFSLYITTNYHKVNVPQYFNSDSVFLENPSDNPTYILPAALASLKRIFKEGYEYKKMGITLFNLKSSKDFQTNMFCTNRDMSKVYTAIDNLNSKWRDCIKIASENRLKEYTDVKNNVSPRYTTNWNELMSLSPS